MKSIMTNLSESLPALASASDSSSSSSNSSVDSSSVSILETDLFDESELPPIVLSTRRSKCRVTFGEVSFRSFPTILGDHPDCHGPPVSANKSCCFAITSLLVRRVISLQSLTRKLALDWDHVREETYDVEEYEAIRAPRKEGDELVLDWLLRKRMLRCFAGVSEEALNERIAESAKIRTQREQSRRSILLKKSNIGLALSKLLGGLIGAKSTTSRKIARDAHCLRFHTKIVSVKC
jgi:hypothetical protein